MNAFWLPPRYLLFGLLLWLATACNAATPQALATLASQSPLPPATRVSPSLTATVAMAAPTTTLRPTPTAAATPTPSPTAAPDLVSTLVTSGEPRQLESAVSPDGDWRAEVVRWECTYLGQVEDGGEYAYEELRLLATAAEADAGPQIIARQLLNCGGLGAFGLGRLQWSTDSRYLHYTDAREGQPDGGIGGWSPPWFVYDRQAKKLLDTQMGPVSPAGDLLIARLDGDLAVWSFQEGEKYRFSPISPGKLIGPIIWSLDEQHILYVQWSQQEGSDFVQLDLKSGEQEILFSDLPDRFAGAFWETPNRILLLDERGREWTLNWETRELVSP